MDRFGALSRFIVWLGRREWGLSLLLGLATLVALMVMSGQVDSVELVLEGPVFRAGFRLGTAMFPDYTTQGTQGFYLVPLFGVAANLLALAALWFVAIRVARRSRDDKPKTQA
jgi:hypothetical protein